MIETRFPSSGLSAEYGDIVISDVTADAYVTIIHSGVVILNEIYTPDANNQIVIKNISELAMLYFEPVELLTETGEYAEPVIFTIMILCVETIVKTVSIYPCEVSFSGTISNELLLQIPLSRATKKNTAPGRKEYISFYGGSTVKAYVVYKGDERDEALSADIAILPDVSKIYTVNVSPVVIAALISRSEKKLIYYNVYTDEGSMIRFMVSSRYQQFEKTFVFRNCFGAQESFTCTGDEKADRKWTREYGDIDKQKIDFSREQENSVKVNTGYISRSEADVVEDLLNSDDISLVTSTGYKKVTIMDEDFNITSRLDEVNSVTFTYRLASKTPTAVYLPLKKSGVFTAEFDNTFEK